MYVLFKILAGWFVLSVTAAAMVSAAMHYGKTAAREDSARDYLPVSPLLVAQAEPFREPGVGHRSQ